MKVSVISVGDRAADAANTPTVCLPTFISGGNAKFPLEVSENTDVICSPSHHTPPPRHHSSSRTLDSIHELWVKNLRLIHQLLRLPTSCPLPRMLFPQSSAWPPSSHSGLGAKVTFSVGGSGECRGPFPHSPAERAPPTHHTPPCFSYLSLKSCCLCLFTCWLASWK